MRTIGVFTWLLLIFGLGGVGTLHAAPSPQPMSIEDAIQLALEHNLDLQITRYEPQLAQYAIDLAYGAYDPTFNFSARRSERSDPGGFRENLNFDIPARESVNDNYTMGIGGELPFGLRYDISSFLNKNSSTQFDPVTGTVAETPAQYSPNVGITLRQPLLKDFWIDASRLQIQVSKKNLKISELFLQQQIMQVVTSVVLAYYDLVFALENVKVQEKALELARESLAENKKRVEVGALAPLDEKQAESQVALSESRLIGAHQAVSARQNAFKALLTADYGSLHATPIRPTEVLVPVPVILDRQESWRRGMTQRPDLLQARIDVEKQDLVLRYNRNQLYPQLDLTGSYGRNGLGMTFGDSLEAISDNENPFHSFGVVLSVPLTMHDARYRYKTSKAQKAQLLLQLKKKEQDILVQIDDAVSTAESEYQRINASKAAREFAEAALDAEQKKLQNGKSTSFQVLILQRDLTNRRFEEIQAMTDYYKALAQLALVEGSSLEKHNINVQVR
jgi:outer membrane protein TolC